MKINKSLKHFSGEVYMENQRIKVITSYKLADAFICQNLEKHFPNMEIIRYKIPVSEQRKWYLRKLKKEGLWRAIGIKLMGIYLGLGNVYNNIRNKTVWQKENLPLPDWNAINAQLHNCNSQNELFELVKNADCIVALDTIRLPQKFFRQIKAPFLQAVYGVAPFYTGHTGIFWAFANHDSENIGISIIQRGKYFNASKILSISRIPFTNTETLRSLRTKGAVKIAQVLPNIIENAIHEKIENITSRISSPINYCTTPTLYFYLRLRALNALQNLLGMQKEKYKSYVYLEV